MVHRRGFTVVELVVVMVIMAILMGFVMVGISGSQSATRDRKRVADIESLARGLEQRYIQGNPVVTRTDTAGGNFTRAGGYPGTLEMMHIFGTDMTASNFTPGIVAGGYREKALPGTTIENFTVPDGIAGQGLKLYCYFCNGGAGVAPEDTAYLAATVGKDTYVYEPLSASGQQCDNEKCTRFNLYGRKEDGTLITIRSKRQ